MITASPIKEWAYAVRPKGGIDLPPVQRPDGIETLRRTEFPRIDERRYYLANGLIGLRLGALPFLKADVAVAGFWGRSIGEEVEGFAPAPYPLEIDIAVGHDRVSQRPDMAHVEQQVFDPFAGELTTTLVFHTRYGRLRIESLIFACRSLPTALCQRLRVTADSDCEFSIESRIDPTQTIGTLKQRIMPRHSFKPEPGQFADTILLWASRDAISTLGVANMSTVEGVPSDRYSTRRNDSGMEAMIGLRAHTIDARAGQTVTMHQVGALVPSSLNSDPHWHAQRVLHVGLRHRGFDRLHHDHRASWAEQWRSRPVVRADDALVQRLIDNSFYLFHASRSSSNPAGWTGYGLSRSDSHYYGHAMAPVETFDLAALTCPHAARAEPDYRWDRFDAARRNAMTLGYRGAMYPIHQAHSGDMCAAPWAHSAAMKTGAALNIPEQFLHYAHATGDRSFLRDRVWPVCREAAEYIVSRVTETTRGYEVHNLCHMEGYTNTHNEPVVNGRFQSHLRWTIALGEQLGEHVPPIWRDAAERMLILTDSDDLRRETAYGKKAGHVNMAEVTAENFREQMGEIIGTPITVQKRWIPKALQLGLRDAAAELWRDDLLCRWHKDFGTFREYSPDWNIHDDRGDVDVGVAVRVLVGATLSFSNLTIGPDDPRQWSQGPAAMPAGWRAIDIDRLWIHGRPWSLHATHGQVADLAPSQQGGP